MKPNGAGYTVGDRLRVTVERIVPGGAGLARGPHGIVLVELSAPGDTVEVEIESLRGGTARGRIRSIIEPSAVRAEPPCVWYGQCGGCDFQHLRYDAQLDGKEAIVRDALARIGGVQWAGPIARIPASQPFGSRTRVELHIDEETGAVGFFERRSQRVVDIDRCIVSQDEIDWALNEIRATGKPRPSAIHLLAGDGVVRSAPAVSPVEGGAFWIPIGSFDYLVDPAGFFQSSLDVLPTLVDYVVEPAESGGRLAWDLFCGVGLFALPLAKRFERVVGIEIDKTAIRHATAGATRNGVDNTQFIAADVTRWLVQRRRQAHPPQLIVVDPPRTGLGSRLATMLTELDAKWLTYVSCDPTTLARDLKILVGRRLRIRDIAIVDLFPQTHHVETIVRLGDQTGG